MSDKPTPQEIEYEKKQYTLALMDRRLQLVGILCQPHIYPSFHATVDTLVAELCTQLKGTHTDGPAVNNIVNINQAIQPAPKKESLPILFGVALVVTADEADKVLEVFGKNVPLELYEVHSSTVYENTTELLVRLSIGVYDTTGKAHIESLLRKMIERSEVLFGKGIWPRLDAYMSFTKLTEYTSVKARVRQQ